MATEDEGPDDDNLLTLEKARQAYYDASDTASTVGRQLALAGVAIVWLFGGGPDVSQIDVPNDLLWPGILLISGLAADFAQYLYKAAVWSLYANQKEKQGIYRFDAPRWINWPTNVLFWGKAVALLVAYGMLAFAMAKRIN